LQQIRDILNGIAPNLEGVNGVHLSQGVVGKTTVAVVALMGVLGVAAYAAGGQWGVIIIALLAAIIFLVYFVGVLWFANKNPGHALLEGAHLVQWRQMDYGAKDLNVIPDTPVTSNPEATRGSAPP
jgi:amino acid transporter